MGNNRRNTIYVISTILGTSGYFEQSTQSVLFPIEETMYGVPTLLIEITSPSTAKIDKTKKLDKFEKSGVKEYWIVEPDNKTVMILVLQNENKLYGRPKYYFEEDKIKVATLDGVEIDLESVFGSINL